MVNELVIRRCGNISLAFSFSELQSRFVTYLFKPVQMPETNCCSLLAQYMWHSNVNYCYYCQPANVYMDILTELVEQYCACSCQN